MRALGKLDAQSKNSPGMVRGPRNLMRGVRSAWTAACRRARVAENMVMVVWWVVGRSRVVREMLSRGWEASIGVN